MAHSALDAHHQDEFRLPCALRGAGSNIWTYCDYRAPWHLHWLRHIIPHASDTYWLWCCCTSFGCLMVQIQLYKLWALSGSTLREHNATRARTPRRPKPISSIIIPIHIENHHLAGPDWYQLILKCNAGCLLPAAAAVRLQSIRHLGRHIAPSSRCKFWVAVIVILAA